MNQEERLKTNGNPIPSSVSVRSEWLGSSDSTTTNVKSLRLRWTAGLATVLLLAGTGCSGEGDAWVDQQGEEAQEEEAQILQHLAQWGYNPNHVEFDGERVTIDREMSISRAALLDASRRVVEKGYTHGSPRAFPRERVLYFFDDVEDDWRQAIEWAASRWSEASGGGLSITVSNEFQQFVSTPVRMHDFGNPGVIAEGGFPPRSYLWINSGGICNGRSQRDFSRAQMRYHALHELGHIIGFEHTSSAGRSDAAQHIEGTSSSNGLVSVMRQGCTGLSDLADDDILSVQIVYAPDSEDPIDFPTLPF